MLYWQRLQQSPDELQALIEALVVPETWFFRHRDAFTALAEMAQDERRARRGTVREAQPLRLLSLPCSTGEEPYSMAMTLFDAGFGADEFTVDALLDGDTKAQSEYFSKALGGPGNHGWMTVNEVRRLKNLPPVVGGDQLIYAGSASNTDKAASNTPTENDDAPDAQATGE